MSILNGGGSIKWIGNYCKDSFVSLLPESKSYCKIPATVSCTIDNSECIGDDKDALDTENNKYRD